MELAAATEKPSTSSEAPPTSDDVIVDENSENLSKMYLNGNSPYYGGYYANRFLPFPPSSSAGHQKTSTSSTSAKKTMMMMTSSSEDVPPPSTSSNGNLKTRGNTISDTVAVAGDDFANVPASVIIQLEKANRTIASQNIEIDRLKSYQNQNVETNLLKKQITDLEKEVRTSRSRFLEQQELLAEMSHEMDNLLREKMILQSNYQEMEKKYKKAKFASRELAKILENDICGTPTTSKPVGGFESDDEYEGDSSKNAESSLFHRSRMLSKQQESREFSRKDESKQLIDKLIGENENLMIDLERERRINESLQDDLEKNRRMVIDREETIEDLKQKLGKSETKATQCESDLTRTSTDLAMERLKSEALTGELHEIEGIFRNTQSTIQAYAIENEQLEDRCRDAHRQILTLNSKLEAQGIDLITTKRTLRTLRENSTNGTF